MSSSLEEMKARVWHASLRLWMWRWQTLTPEQRAVFYTQQKFGITYHFAWVLGYDWGIKDDFEPSDFLLRERGRRAFAPGNHEKIIGPGWVQYKFFR